MLFERKLINSRLNSEKIQVHFRKDPGPKIDAFWKGIKQFQVEFRKDPDPKMDAF